MQCHRNKTEMEAAIIQDARNYCRAIGRDPATIRNVDDAKKYLDWIAEDCKRWGSN